jgi:hypothetical protein
MTSDFKLLMLGAMYENGGNTTHRFLDGHPQMFVYPFESQVGTRHVLDNLTSVFPVKYRWPSFLLDASPIDDYRAIIDEECKVRARTPHVSKFRHMEFDFSDDERLSRYTERVHAYGGRSSASNVAAFFRATFDAWKNFNRSGEETFYVGYSPIITVDADKILDDLPQAHFLHIVRNPWSAYADTKKRPVPLSLHDYMFGWTTNQYFALLNKEKYPDRMHILRLEDIIAKPAQTLGDLCEELGLRRADTLKTPTWNGNALDTVYPWGTIKKATPEANKATADELSTEEKNEIKQRTWQYLDTFDYTLFLSRQAIPR